MGLSHDNIEMLFTHPSEQAKGYGKELIEYAIHQKGIRKVDVNEQNEKALRFYLNRGLKQSVGMRLMLRVSLSYSAPSA